MADHTPGPWEHGPNTGGNTCIWEEGAEEDPIARICSRGADPDSDASAVEREANARLIAAAPELLGLAIDLLEHCNADLEDMVCDAGNPDGGSAEPCDHCQTRKLRDRIAAIVAKATCPKEVS